MPVVVGPTQRNTLWRSLQKIHMHGISDADHNQTRKPSALVTLIVDLRGESKRRRDREHEQAKSLGMHFVTIPGNGWSSPTDQQIAQFFALIRERPPHKNLRPLLVRW